MGEIWHTIEPSPRLLMVAGRSGIDPDCLVAYAEGKDNPLWIVEHSGYVCGLGEKFYAKRGLPPTFVDPCDCS